MVSVAGIPGRPPLSGRRWWLACGLVLTAALAATVPTTGDFGLTWDEPAYRYSQLFSIQWWERLARVRSWSDLAPLFDSDTLLYYWPYGRYGINFHPPLAGQLNLLTYALFGSWMKDIPARRMASVLEYALTITMAFGFLSRRYGAWVGGVAAGCLLLMPRVYGDGHLAATDTPGLFLWAATALAFWKGLHEPGARRWRILVGMLLGLAFVEKMSAVGVLVPLLGWLVVGHLPRVFTRRGGRHDAIDGIATSAAMLVPLGVAALEIRRLSAAFLEIQRVLGVPNFKRSAAYTNLFRDRPASLVPGAILLVPLLVWLVRRLLARLFPRHPVWGVERPALETWCAILAFAPVVGWLGNPAWWRETLPRLAHYAMLSGGRKGTLPEIQILYLGRTYLYSLPWHNAWTLIAITVPAGILTASVVGLAYVVRYLGRGRLPFYFLVHLATLPVLRMFPTPAHDGVRLFLPTFFFLAAMAGWGLVWAADGLALLVKVRAVWVRSLLAGLVLGSAGWQLVRIHPFELSYYNELIGGPRGAWRAGFELSYWYDAFDQEAIDAVNRDLPRGASVTFSSELSEPPTFLELQWLGVLRGDLLLDDREVDRLPYMWLLTQDSKATALTRLLFAMRPWYARRPRQLDGLRVFTVADPVAVSRAAALQLLLDAEGPPHPPVRVPLPRWLLQVAPWLGRFWGAGLTPAPRLAINEPMLRWARQDPEGLRAAARELAAHPPVARDSKVREKGSENVERLLHEFLGRWGNATPRYAEVILRDRPEAVREAVETLISRPDAVRRVLLREPFTDPDDIGGYLDRDLPSGPSADTPSWRAGEREK